MRTLIALILLATSVSPVGAQLPTDDYRGVGALGLALRELATSKRVLVVAAHPDDEDTQIISVLSLRDGADVAYLSLTRGEGGQNSIGGELGPALGLLRTGELLAARALDRGDQYFSRAYDFGFSKTADETLRHWPRDSILADAVGVVRRYRPDIIVAVFSGTPSDGHGHHQVSGMLAREAFEAAADPARFPEQLRAGLRPHRALKLFQSANFRGTPTHRIATGVLDPLLGRSYSQAAAASRSRHRSQDFGLAQTPGPRTTALALIQSRVEGTGESLFAGIDTTLAGRAAAARESAAVRQALLRYDSLVARAQAVLSPYHTEPVAPLLAAAIRELRGSEPAIASPDVRFAVQQEIAAAEAALLLAARVVIDAVGSTAVVVSGETFTLAVSVWNGGAQSLRVGELTPALPAGWQFTRTDSSDAVIAPGNLHTYRFTVQPPPDAQISQPYFLRQPRRGDLYAWPPGSESAGQPFEPAAVRVRAALVTHETTIAVEPDASWRTVDPRQGEVRRSIRVAPAFVVRADPAVAVTTRARIATGADRGIAASVEVRSNGRGGSVVIRPVLPAGWQAAPAEARAMLAGAGALQTVPFAITPPRGAAAGSYEVRFAVHDSAGRRYDLAERVVDYEHVRSRALYEPAVLRVGVLDARFARGLRVGYIVGTDPEIPTVLRQLGMSVDVLDADALRAGDLGRYDAVVVGSRAYEVRPDVVAHNGRLLDYGRNGGNVVTLYQQQEFIDGRFAPYELTLARPHDRITDEASPVRMLAPSARALTRPNRIGAHDFDGWVQDRALYMPRTWAPEYTPLLEMTDPDEAPKHGAIVTAPLGKGFYTYTGIAFFRQIPAAVPGALRLFINLLSLGLDDQTL